MVGELQEIGKEDDSLLMILDYNRRKRASEEGKISMKLNFIMRNNLLRK
jgi:hypothetical protein